MESVFSFIIIKLGFTVLVNKCIQREMHSYTLPLLLLIASVTRTPCLKFLTCIMHQYQCSAVLEMESVHYNRCI